MIPRLMRATVLTDDPHIYHGTPVGVQLVGKRFQEEKVLAIGEVIEGALKAFNRKKATYERL